MSKRKIDGDVLVNRLSVGLANHKKLLASWTGLQTEAEPHAGASREGGEEDDFKDEALGHEQLGIGGIVPKNVQNGSLTRRPLTSDDKLLQQLLGKKAAKAHIAARQAPKENNNTQKPALGPRNAQPEESDEEEDGRASTFKSKRRKICQTNATGNIEECSDDPKKISDLERRGNADECGLQASSEKQLPKDDHDHDEDPSPQSRRKPKSASYLDEILAERSKRKKKKAKNKSETAT